MFPIHDNIPSRTTPFVNYSMIAVCALVFLWQLGSEQRGVSQVERYGMIPARVLQPEREVVIREPVVVVTRFGPQQEYVKRLAAPSAVPPILTLLTCVFLHGSWMHFLGNVWFLHIFGDNVEDRLGHVGYLIFYLGSGIAASVAHLLTNQGSDIPTIGASGAIAGVMGAYMCMYPRATVLSVVPIVVFLWTIVLPAPIFLGIWFALQFFQGVASVTNGPAGGVAWWAHIGGFVVGFVVAKALDIMHQLNPPVQQRRIPVD
ncbi:MAG: rhomboid family intramembrane serine protease, partial [Planctomycetales bacterium]|nr:rhomboid family intramembrane serine protease [Planctomycetales bacterium]